MENRAPLAAGTSRRSATSSTLFALWIIGLIVSIALGARDRQRSSASEARAQQQAHDAQRPAQAPSSSAARKQNSAARESAPVADVGQQGVALPTFPAPDQAASAQQAAPVAQLDHQPAQPFPSVPQRGAPVLIDDWRFSWEPGLDTAALQQQLERFPGTLKSMTIFVGDRTMTMAEVIIGQSTLYSFNPKVLLVLLEQQHGLLSNPNASLSADETHAKVMRLAGELYRGQRAVAGWAPLAFSDGSVAAAPQKLNAGSYVVARLLAQQTTAGGLAGFASEGSGSFVAIYSALFEDPRQPTAAPTAFAAPFLAYPKAVRSEVTSFFDHEAPLLDQNGSMMSYWGKHEHRIAYDGHSGWDFGGLAGGGALAAAPGTVIFAGWSNDGCWTPAGGVIIDHGNGYRTLYWHLDAISVRTGQQVVAGETLGVVGGSGCAVGPHLHFQVLHNGRVTDPYGWCSGNDPWAGHPLGAPSVWLWADSPNPCQAPGNATLVAVGGEGFSASGTWRSASTGVGGSSLWAVAPQEQVIVEQIASAEDTVSALLQPSEPAPAPATVTRVIPAEPTAFAAWRPQLANGGSYRVMAFVPMFYTGAPESTKASYTVHHADGATEVRVDQQLLANGWADLGTYRFDAGVAGAVELNNNTGGSNEGVWAGALLWLPAE